MRIGAIAPFRIGNADRLEDLERSVPGLRPGKPEMDLRDLRDLASDALQRIELAAGIGHHHRELTPAQHAPLLACQACDVAAVKADPSCVDRSGRRHHAHDAARQRGLAGAGLADHADDLAALDRQIDAPERCQRRRRIAAVADAQALDLQDRCVLTRSAPGRSSTRVRLNAPGDRPGSRPGRRSDRRTAKSRRRRSRSP